MKILSKKLKTAVLVLGVAPMESVSATPSPLALAMLSGCVTLN
jgi:hypothetical protein